MNAIVFPLPLARLTMSNAFYYQVSNIERLRESFAKASSETHAGSKTRQSKMLNMKMILAGMIL